MSFGTAVSLLFVLLWLLVLALCWKPWASENAKRTAGVEPDDAWPRRMGSNPRPNYPMPPAPPNPPPAPRLDETTALAYENRELRRLLGRYLDETPLGHQPHMIAHEVEDVLGRSRRPNFDHQRNPTARAPQTLEKHDDR